MPRLPYADPDSPETAALARRIIAERGKMLDLYRMLLHAPDVAEGWLACFTAIRQRCTLPGLLRELVIIRIAHLNGASYEAEQHVPFALKEGATQAQLDALADWETATVFAPAERAALAYADAMTRQIQVPEPVFAAVRDIFDHRMLVELTATIAGYNMVSRFLEALQIHATGTAHPPA